MISLHCFTIYPVVT